MSREDMRKLLDRYEMAHIGSWTICNTVRYSLYPALRGNNPPDPEHLLLLSDEDNLLDGEAGTDRLLRSCDSYLVEDYIEPSRVLAYLRLVPPENILWLDVATKIGRDRWWAALGTLQPSSKMTETKLARTQLDWMKGHRDGTEAFDRYLSRLEQVVQWYEENDNSGPAWGSAPGYQWEPLKTWSGFPYIAFLEKHPHQTTKSILLMDNED